MTKYLVRIHDEYAVEMPGTPIKFKGFEPVQFIIYHSKFYGYNISEVQTGMAIVHLREWIENRREAVQKAKERLNSKGLKFVLDRIAETTPVSGLRQDGKFIIRK